jgi:L-Ala-D/L-Glu epimerase
VALIISAVVERWPVAGQFIISRGAKTHVDVVVAAVSYGDHIGMGEGTPIYYRGENGSNCLTQIETVTEALENASPKEARLALQDMLGPGAARNALDCALWDIEAKLAGVPLWQYAGLKSEPKPLITAFTISLGEAAVMEADAAKAAAQGFGLLKLKLTGEGDRARVAAVHRGAPTARLIVDANESWGGLDIAAEAAALAEFGVEMVEQPVADGADAQLASVQSPLPIFADEGCHSAADVARLSPYYDGINIKLDKAGGLTEAMKMADAADAAGKKIMTGCMLSTSLGIAPAFLLAQRADWVDLDGAALLAEDREGGFRIEGGMILP